MPSKSFGIKHSPYVGSLKGDDWVSARTETMSSPVTTKTETRSVSVSGVPVVNGSTSRESKVTMLLFFYSYQVNWNIGKGINLNFMLLLPCQ